MNELELAIKIAKQVASLGGKTYYVGGYVRDKILQKESKDIDIEIHGITPNTLEALLAGFGPLITIGKSFGIYNIKGNHLDIALPRMESKTGVKHTDFLVEVDPFIGTKRAALRRDFTMNSIYQDVLTNEFIDHFGGINDIKNKIIRHIDDKTFAEDPLRVLRAASFAARYDFKLAEETIALCESIDISALSKERIEEEVKKALLKGSKPSKFFNTLLTFGKLAPFFDELLPLIHNLENETHHLEKTTYNHTMQVLDAGAKYLNKVEHPYYFMMACLCHDFGKIHATRCINGIIHAYGHEIKADEDIKRFLKRFSSETNLKKYVINMTHNHMRPHILAHDNSKIKSTNKMYDDSICPIDLIYLSFADNDGSTSNHPVEHYESFLFDRYELYLDYMKRPKVTGDDLIKALGDSLDVKYFKEALAFAHDLHLAGVDKESALKQTLKMIEKKMK